jgi:hypothetical protein
VAVERLGIIIISGVRTRINHSRTSRVSYTIGLPLCLPSHPSPDQQPLVMPKSSLHPLLEGRGTDDVAIGLGHI